MADMKTTRAPYNFVPMTERIIWRYEGASQLPRHDVLDPELLTGQIRVTITAETPIFISGREKGAFATDARGRYIIPGSSLRGLLRQNMQILGLGLIRPGEDFNDLRLLYRDMTSGRQSVTYPLRERYISVLGIDNKDKDDPSSPKKVEGGYLYREGGKYYIAPAAGKVLSISRRSPLVSNWAQRFTFSERIWYKSQDEKVLDICTAPTEGYQEGMLHSPGNMNNTPLLYVFPDEGTQGRYFTYSVRRSDWSVSKWQNSYDHAEQIWFSTRGPRIDRIQNAPGGWCQKGVLLAPGKLGLENCIYLYAQSGSGSNVYKISKKAPIVEKWARSRASSVQVWYKISGETVTDIKTTETEGYQKGRLLIPNPVSSQNHLYIFPKEDPNAKHEKLGDDDVLSYKEDVAKKSNVLKGTDKDHPMRPAFWNMPSGEERKPVFFVKHDGHIYFGTSRFLRIGYAHPIGHGIPQSHTDALDSPKVDYPHSLFGFTSDHAGYRTRISVGDLVADGAPRPLPKFSIVPGAPKPSFLSGYIRNGKSYNDNGFQLNGLKQYWMKEEQIPKSDGGQEKKSVAQMAPLPSGTKFTGTIRYRNLHKDELGLLLWCLRLDPGHFQTIGMGKPYGFGRIAVQIDALEEFDIPGLYQDLIAGPVANGTTTARVEALIRAYDEAACDALASPDAEKLTSLRDLSHIKDFLYMKRTIRTDTAAVSYLTLNEHRNITAPLPTVSSIRGETDRPALTAADLKAMFDRRNAANSASRPKRK